MVARQQQMRAVVDMHAGRGIVIGAASAAGLTRGFVHGDRDSRLRQTHGSGKAGKSGADNMNVLCHQKIAYRKTAQQQMHAVDAHALARRRKSALLQPVEHRRIGLGHDARRLHAGTRLPVHDGAGLAEMLARPLDQRRAGLPRFGCAKAVFGSSVMMPAASRYSRGR